MDTHIRGCLEGGNRPRLEYPVLPDEGAVEVAGDGGDVPREAVGEDQCVDWKTYSATSAICFSLSWSPNEGMAP
jgi:hypothetical protein